MGATIAELKAWLAKENGLSWKEEGDGVVVEAPSAVGFPVWIVKEKDEWAVGFGEGWYDHFDDEADAVECCLQGCTGQIREVTKFRGNIPLVRSIANRRPMANRQHDRNAILPVLEKKTRRIPTEP